MAPKAAQLEKALVDAAHDLFRTDRGNLTVNAVRKQVEDDLGLESGFFKTDEWKAKSKDLITTTANKLLDAEDESEEQGSTIEAKVKPQADVKKPPKTQKPPPKAQSPTKKRGSTEKTAAEPDVRDANDKPKKQPSKKRKLAHRKVAESSDEDEDDASDAGSAESFSGDENDEDGNNGTAVPKTGSRRKKAKTKAAQSDSDSSLSDLASDDHGNESGLSDESEMSEVIDVAPPKRRKQTSKGSSIAKQPRTKKKGGASTAENGHESDSSLSSVLDDGPRPKQTQAKRASGGGQTGRRRSSTAKAASASPEDAEIKKLQGQLVKCGVRKIWGFELKKYGDDAHAKIRHLKGMLRDLGMDGRFSESKAREIKERRELEADLEAVQEMNRSWGVNTGGRPLRNRKIKSFKEESSDDDENGENDDDDDDVNDGVKKGKRSRNDRSDKGGGSDEENANQDDNNEAKEREDDNKDDEDDHDDDEDDGEKMPKTWAKGRSSRSADLAFLGSESESDSD
ncbi:hypothetical protein SPI_02048 [Niveomyces insectorum RCEF 264]|uniref:Transcriptional regulator n=1 Tax=Niveomyces insectorum RCEF 264 TaxID=1081102 RepID=A0A167XQG4_9HYPO|nr:hypothetical protein SPI_02048 [Niveomyces insectorum RCEF 264]